MSGTHERMLCMDGLRSVESEVALINCPGVATSMKRRNIKLKGTTGERKSRR